MAELRTDTKGRRYGAELTDEQRAALVAKQARLDRAIAEQAQALADRDDYWIELKALHAIGDTAIANAVGVHRTTPARIATKPKVDERRAQHGLDPLS